MLRIPSIFASHALYQADSRLTVHGNTDGSATRLSAVLYDREGAEFARSMTEIGADGTFRVTLPTPAASFDPYSLVLTAGEETLTLSDLLFGEVWIASGQSNMELFNYFMDDAETQFDAMKGKQIRVFQVSYATEFPYDPNEYVPAEWYRMEDAFWEGIKTVSGAGLRFADALYNALNRDGKQVPVGLYNASWGATSILSWLPHSEIEKDAQMQALLTRVGALPTRENWNTKGDLNFQQTGAQYNVKIAPLSGTTARGLLWYQGENETAGEFDNRIYADCLRFYHRVYARQFAHDPAHFMMLSSLLYPWFYGASGECCMGYLNQAFVETATEAPDRFAVAPIADLPPVWGYAFGNHPIHPTNKYAVGDRLARLALTNAYGFPGQKAPASLVGMEKQGDRLLLAFRDVGTGLSLAGRVHGLYLAGADGKYLPAECEIVAPDMLAVFSPEIPEPQNVAYAMQSLEPDINLFAGDFPVCPFHTDDKTRLTIEQRAWYDMSVTSRWITQMHDDVLDVFYRPVWQTTDGSALCPDRAFRFADAVSLRVLTDRNPAETESADFGCFVRSYPYHRLDLQNYRALRFNLFPAAASAQLVLYTAAGETVLTPQKTADHLHGWRSFEVSLSALPDDEITRMEFRFHNESSIRFANIEHLRLVP